jgi:NTE family protein
MISDRVVLALGGGAAKGLAHVGVLRGLDEDGVTVAGIAGTSMGSIIGALTAQGLGARDMEALFRAVDWVRLGRILVTSVSGAAFHDMIRESFGRVLIEDLELPYAAVCCDLDSGEMVSLDSGSLAEAVCASSSIPGILPPRIVGGRRLVDGAVVEPVPATAARSLGPGLGPVLAVNVVRPPGPNERGGSIVPSMRLPVELPAAFGRVDRWLRRQRSKSGEGEIRARLSRWETVLRSFHIMQQRLATCGHADVSMIEPETGRFGWFDFHQVGEIVEAGYRAYRQWADESPA